MKKTDPLALRRQAEELRREAAELIARSRKLHKSVEISEDSLHQTEKLTARLHDKIRKTRLKTRRAA
jgi:hypothetical protein